MITGLGTLAETLAYFATCLVDCLVAGGDKIRTLEKEELCAKHTGVQGRETGAGARTGQRDQNAQAL